MSTPDTTALQLEIRLPSDYSNIVQALAGSHYDTKFYWRGREKTCESACLGAYLEFHSHNRAGQDACWRKIEHYLGTSRTGFPLYGGISFNLSELFFFCPCFEIQTSESGVSLKVSISRSELEQSGFLSFETELARLLDMLQSDQDCASPIQLSSPVDLPNRAEWSETARAALADIRAGESNKLVLARRRRYANSGSLGWEMLKRLRLKSDKSYTIAFERAGALFLSATPERLYLRQGTTVHTEAIAGTSEQTSSTSAADLLDSSKEMQEHSIVVQGIHKSLQEWSSHISADSTPQQLKVGRLQHLHSRIQARDVNCSDRQLLESLHPTPAVGGFPKERFPDLCAKYEQFDRRMYAAPIGWIEREKAEFAVGIRSAYCDGNALTLYAGAGLVAESLPEREWDETEAKFRAFADLLA